MFDVANLLQQITIKDNYELLNIQACSFNVLEKGVHPISSGKLQIPSSSSNIH